MRTKTHPNTKQVGVVRYRNRRRKCLMANRSAPYTQADVTRAVKGAIAAGLKVREVFASSDGVRVVVGDPQKAKLPLNDFDEVLNETS